MRQDGILTYLEEDAMQVVADCAVAVEAKLGGKPEVVVWVDIDPMDAYRRIGKRDQPDDSAIQLAELRAIDLLHRTMMRKLVQSGTTVVHLHKVCQSQKTQQLLELTGYLESKARGNPGAKGPVFITVQEPVSCKDAEIN